ncbi:MAG: lipopolysaccharide biosynthesis protein [Alphaproteobacteria bacterium]|nr:lipopolysaccharide biosynthesis protein [Alphaproteobacteria bacterium]
MLGPRPTDVKGVRADLKRLALRGGAITMSAQAILFLIQMVSVIALARLLAPEAFGLLAIATFFTGFLAVFGDLGLGYAVIQRQDLNEEQLTALFWINLGVSFLLALLTAGLAPLVSWIYGHDDVLLIMLVLALAYPISGAAAQHRALLMRQMRYGRLKAIEIAAALVALLVGICAAWWGYGYWALVAMTLTGAIVSLVLLWGFSGWRPGLPRPAKGIGSLLRFGLDITGFNALNYLARNADNALIGWVWGPAALGFYTRAYALLMAPLQQLNRPLSSVAIATLSRLAGEPDAYANAYRRIVEKILLITMPLTGLLLATSDLVIEVLLGPRCADAAPIFLWLAVAALYQPLAQTTGWLFITQGRTGEMLRWGAISVPITLASFLVGLPFGAVGVAAAYALGGLFILVPMLFWYVGRRGPVLGRDLTRLLACFSVLAAAAAGAAFAARLVWESGQPLYDILMSWGAALPVIGLTTMLFAPTRAAAFDTVQLLRELSRPKARPEAQENDSIP